MSEPTAVPVRSEARLSVAATIFNAVKMLLVFAVLGPPFGWFTLLVPMTVYGLVAGWGDSLPPNQFGSNLVFMALSGAFFSYYLGLPIALLAGIIVVLGQLAFRSFGLVHAVAAAFVTGLVWTWCPDLLTWLFYTAFPAAQRTPLPSRSFLERSFGTTVSNVALIWASVSAFCLVPIVACWAIGRLCQTKPSQAAPC